MNGKSLELEKGVIGDVFKVKEEEVIRFIIYKVYLVYSVFYFRKIIYRFNSYCIKIIIKKNIIFMNKYFISHFDYFIIIKKIILRLRKKKEFKFKKKKITYTFQM